MKNDTKLRKYLDMRGISVRQAAKEIGVSRPLIHYALNGHPLGRRTSLMVEEWSDGWITAAEMAGLDNRKRKE